MAARCVTVVLAAMTVMATVRLSAIEPEEIPCGGEPRDPARRDGRPARNSRLADDKWPGGKWACLSRRSTVTDTCYGAADARCWYNRDIHERANPP
jgi:hypothetical protein